MLRDIQLIIYDMDGVLIDSTQAIIKSFENTLKELDLDYGIDELRDLMGNPLRVILEKMLRRSIKIWLIVSLRFTGKIITITAYVILKLRRRSWRLRAILKPGG